jgi:hypothetical protein
MKAKTLSLVAGMALAANVGVAQAAELDETAGVPDILGSMDTASYQAMSQEEMAVVEGKFGSPNWPFPFINNLLIRLAILNILNSVAIPSYPD